jgi:nudix-type nucleoside diphosphatase (YffH/AdpP family)
MAQVKIKDEKILSNERHPLKKISFSIQKKDGSWQDQEREVYDHGNAVTALLYNKERRTFILTRQFRLATHINGNPGGMLTEACAGLLDEKEGPDDAIKREIEEETGYKIDQVNKIYQAYSSAGAYTELIYYYTAEYTPDQKTGEGGGLEEEQEEVEVLELPADDAYKLLDSGAIADAKTIILLQYARLKGW